MDKILTGRSDTNIKFYDLRRFLLRYGFSKWMRGDHHIFSREDIPEIINLQPLKSGNAKPYQVREVRALFLKYKFHLKQGLNGR